MSVLRVVSYNVHGLRDDRAALVEVVRGLDPDVLVVQEAPRRLGWRGRVARLAHDLDLVHVTGGAPSLGNVVMSKLRVRALRSWALRYPLTPGRHLRGAAFARCEVAGAGFVVVGSHLSTDPTERLAQAQRLAKALADLDAPVILGVDLNEPPGGPAWEVLGLADTGPADAAPTYPAAAPRYRIDAVLVDPRVGVTASRVVDSPAARRASDHLPVLAELTLPG